MTRLAVWPLLLAVTLASCQRERWELPCGLGGAGSRSSNYAHIASEPPLLLFLHPLHHPDTSTCLFPPLAPSTRLTVVATAAGSIIAFAPTDSLWTYRLPKGVVAASAMAADTSTLYVLGTDGVLYALTFGGSLRWQKALFQPLTNGGGPYTHLLPLRDGVVAGEVSGRLVRISSAGLILWEQRRGASVDRLPAADESGNVLIGLTGGPQGDTVLLIDPSGQQRWARGLPGTRLSCSPVVGKSVLFAAGVREGPTESTPVVHAFTASGQLFWSQTLPAVPRWLSVDDANTVFIVAHSRGIGEPISAIFAYDSTGQQRWKLYIQATVATPAIVFRNELLVFVRYPNGALAAYTLSRADGSLRDMVSLKEAPPLLLSPTVAPDGSILLAWSTRLGFLRLGEHPWRWLLF
ncbi:MAG: PQQ-binding-like beta-propeller repeat protein [Chlorobiota bacterium]